MALAALSYVCAQEEYSFLCDPPSILYSIIKRRADGFRDFEVSAGGVMVKADFEYSGYELRQAQYGRGSVLVPVYGEEASFRVDYQVYGEMGNYCRTAMKKGRGEPFLISIGNL